ncbi:MAG: insulinase family protein [Alphaproteobacteria bacterium]|nr:insulinase family protein [Alphaproteobacteria bacterium]
MAIAITRLDSGLRVATDSMDGIESTTLGVWVDAGARDETADLNGISHLLEHMAFKGTARRSATQIAEEIEAVGGHLNAYTSREQTAYYARVLAADVAVALDIIADILQGSVFAADELEREIRVISQEIAQVDDTPDDLIFDQFQSVAYPGQAMGRSILGTADGIARFASPTLRDFMGQQYRADRMVLVGAGSIDHGQVVDLAAVAFDRLAPPRERSREQPVYRTGDQREERDLEQLHLVLGFDGVGYHDSRYFPLQVLSTLLGGGMSSRLFQEVREKRGLAYAIHSFSSAYVDGGLIGVYAGCDGAQAGELLAVVCDELGRSGSGVTAAELDRAKAQLKAGLLMALESSSSRAEQLARHLLVFDRPIPTAEMVARVDAVTVKDVGDLAATIFRGDRMTLTALGPLANVAAYDRLAARLG